ncbi:efflux transporter outer membrane subunit [Caballeronia sp. LZ025]|uniref:efflux transporter outer membrane subunit n=1 Tax=Caballeronia TaxID=1827195 RepID=UPI00245473A0|nr:MULTISPECIES: efflux transporter outer membrane subunit [Caballeronia]MDR5735628.1 efflux transporter outer membrane subunit [Caballeronia sp. LZ025]
MKRWLGLPALMASLLVVAGCSLAPTYEKPDVNPPAAYKETPTLSPSEAGTWKTAQPSEEMLRGEWWTVFDDATLNDLERQAQEANQNLKAAAARVKESRAINQTARAGLFPTLDAGFGPTREKFSPASQFLPPDGNVPAQTLWRAQASVSYEVDLFGRVSNSVQAANADTEQSQALFRSVQLALQADVAQNYFNLRELDAEADVFARTVSLREEALKLVQRRFAEGDISELDVARARSELATARSDAMTVQRLRAASEHGLAVLLGKAPAQFTMAANPLKPVTVRLPPDLPSSLLERRPDIAAAERSMAAANARIGVAKAAFFPSLTLTGSGGFESATLGDLFNWSSRTFLLGPFAGTMLNLPIFDGGRRKGNLANARAIYEEDVANYRQQVLVAFREVEDNLSDLRILETQTTTQADAVNASVRAAQLSRRQYTEGAVNYLDVIDAERTVLQSQRAAVQLAGTQAVSTVNLIRALGGGWGDAMPTPVPEPSLAKN